MLLYRGFFELFIFSFFLLSKEILFYGEERLIVVCYLFLLFLGFFNLSEGVAADFNSRAQAIKDELDQYFYTLINTLIQTKEFITLSYHMFLNILKLHNSMLDEFYFYFLFYYNNSEFKRFMINYNVKDILSNTNEFFWGVRNALIKKHTTKFLLNEYKYSADKKLVNVNKYNLYLSLVNKQLSLKTSAKSSAKSAPYFLSVASN